MRICADCGAPIRLRERWKIDGSRVRHICCGNPLLTQPALPLWTGELRPATPAPEEPPRPATAFRLVG
jgi:hypothetical protein